MQTTLTTYTHAKAAKQAEQAQINKQLTDVMMSLLGVKDMAYIKPSEDVNKGYAVHAADGTELATFETRAEAERKAGMHKLALVSIH